MRLKSHLGDPARAALCAAFALLRFLCIRRNWGRMQVLTAPSLPTRAQALCGVKSLLQLLLVQQKMLRAVESHRRRPCRCRADHGEPLRAHQEVKPKPEDKNIGRVPWRWLRCVRSSPSAFDMVLQRPFTSCNTGALALRLEKEHFRRAVHPCNETTGSLCGCTAGPVMAAWIGTSAACRCRRQLVSYTHSDVRALPFGRG